MTFGICTLANDWVYDQVVALLNSIEVNGGCELPVCILPYDDQLDRLQELIRQRPQVQLFHDREIIARWDDFVARIWALHPDARRRWNAIGSKGIHRMGTHRRLCAFDGPFERFFYMDADTLLLSSIQPLARWLDTYDWVSYDFQYKHLAHVYEVASPRLWQVFSPQTLHDQVFCSGFYGSHRGLFSARQMHEFWQHLSDGEAEILYPMAPDQTILNYLVMRSNVPSVNLAHALSPAERTGNSANSKHFQRRQGRLYDQGRPLTYLHYIGIPADCFGQLCRGQNIDVPYRDLFLHYRYHHSPEQRPRLLGRKRPYQKPKGKLQRLLGKLGLRI